ELESSPIELARHLQQIRLSLPASRPHLEGRAAKLRGLSLEVRSAIEEEEGIAVFGAELCGPQTMSGAGCAEERTLDVSSARLEVGDEVLGASLAASASVVDQQELLHPSGELSAAVGRREDAEPFGFGDGALEQWQGSLRAALGEPQARAGAV